jgi:hypothetical protein
MLQCEERRPLVFKVHNIDDIDSKTTRSWIGSWKNPDAHGGSDDESYGREDNSDYGSENSGEDSDASAAAPKD